METIEFKGETYLALQAKGHAAKFALPFAFEILHGRGLDVGCNRKTWCLPGTVPVDPAIDPKHSANELPFNEADHYGEWDFIFSSHALEHIDKWVTVLDHWHSKLKPGGTVFLYLPDFSQKYWRGWSNRKHVNMFTPEIIKAYFTDQPEMWENVFCSGVDLNNSFICVAQKK